MQVAAEGKEPQTNYSGRRAAYFLIPLVVGAALLLLAVGLVMMIYQADHRGRVLTGVSAAGVDLSRQTPAEAQALLGMATAAVLPTEIALIAPDGQELRFAPEQLGIMADAEQTAAAAYAVGRKGLPLRRIRESFRSWYFGREIAPVVVLDEQVIETTLQATGIDRPDISASLMKDAAGLAYTPAQTGLSIDRPYLRQSLIETIRSGQPARIELLVHESMPPVYDPPGLAGSYQTLSSDAALQFYFPEPLSEDDLLRLDLQPIDAADWLHVEMVTMPDGRLQHQIVLDENAVRNWLGQIAAQVERAPVNARYYFDDDTRELVLIAPHTNGRTLDIEATVAGVRAGLAAGNHNIPLIVEDIVPVAHSGAAAAELGITELITETTTWFYGSADERKHNIARAAANFYGIVIAPGEEFSFNRYLGSISEADGYEQGLVIVGGRTIEGIGGGVCQVSTTIYQTAFWSGFPIVERWAHGYMVNYYNDGEGPGMDATVYQPIVDFRFTNNTPHHLLIENYYSEEFQSLTFKFYSTSMGRRVVKGEPVVSNETPAPTEDVWEYDPEIAEGTVAQYDYAAGGADVAIQRTVYNAAGEIIDDRTFVSNYIPWPNVYRYGPGVQAGDYSLVNAGN